MSIAEAFESQTHQRAGFLWIEQVEYSLHFLGHRKLDGSGLFPKDRGQRLWEERLALAHRPIAVSVLPVVWRSRLLPASSPGCQRQRETTTRPMRQKDSQ